MKYLLILLAVLSFGTVFSQSWFIQQTGSTQPINVIKFTSVNTGYCAGPAGRFFKTTNGGNVWNEVITNLGGRIFDMSFPDAVTGYAGGVSGKLIKTTNSGTSWFELETGSPQIYSVLFTNASTGFLLAQSTQNPNHTNILKSTNGGLNWHQELGVGERLYNIQNLEGSSAILFACGAMGITMKSTDYGDNWQVVLPIYGGIFWAIHPFTITTIVAAAQNSIYRSSNSGSNWTWLPLAPPTDFRDIYMVNHITGYTAGTSGHIFKTYNGGVNWHQLDHHNDTTTFLSIFFTDENTGYFSRNDGRITKTTNGGGLPIGIEPVSSEIPAEFLLEQNYPNPFNPLTGIEFSIAKSGYVQLIIHDITGREIAQLVKGNLNAGSYNYDFDASSLTSGVYFYTLASENFKQTKKMTLIK
jgi:photosystem II stability/assembly factor-like uncharacterized protein